MSEENKYWHILDEFEPVEDVRVDENPKVDLNPTSRRNFLKVLGLGSASAALIASCTKRPIDKAIPFFVKPEEITPGKAAYYASGYFEQNEFCSVLVKVRDSRPIKLEPNPKSVITPTGTSGKVQASVLNVYNVNRFNSPLKQGDKIEWNTADKEIVAKLRELSASGKSVVFLTPTIISPSTKRLIKEFEADFGVIWKTHDALTMDGYREANKRVFGNPLLPEYHFDKAECIVSLGADFLGTWLSPVEFTKQYGKRRDLRKGTHDLNRHYQIEGGMSLSGSNADERIRADRSDYGRILTYIYNHLAAKRGADVIETKPPQSDVIAKLNNLLADLDQNQGKALVVCGDNSPELQVIVNGINHLIGSYGNTITWNNHYNHYQGDESWINELLDQNLGGVILWNINPVYDSPVGRQVKEAIEKVELSVSISALPDETTELCEYVLPSPSYLESWDDAEYKSGVLTIMQPTLHKLFDARQAQESLLSWLGDSTPWREYIKSNWKNNYYPYQTVEADKDRFWINAVRSGEFQYNANPVLSMYNEIEVKKSLSKTSKENVTKGFTLELVENINIGTGHGPLNPWLQECPDPVTRIAWDNYASISPSVAREKGIKNGDVVNVAGLSIPAFVQPGQADKTISIAVGYGRRVGIPDNLVTGVNVYHLATIKDGYRTYFVSDVQLEKTGEFEKLALVQGHQSQEGRPLAREATLKEYKHDHHAGNELHHQVEHHATSLYPGHEYTGHKWAMAIDLSKCTGCSACVLACNTENNIPVVGKKEVLAVHEMAWIRIDRYYSGEEDAPEVVRQPVMCQHCDNAPCENVCPVAATNHSSEGLNQMAYNRCIGTRYCNNNCPYKVRRFNWLDYTGSDSIPFNRYDPASLTVDLSRMRHNPDVTVRAKGVIEKCSFCVQRIQEKKLNAKLEGRPLYDGELQSACQQSCSANAIVFGDVNDPNSEVAKMMEDPRNYHLLEEIHTLPSVGYLTKIRNKS